MHKNWLIITFLIVAVVGLYFIWEKAPIGVSQDIETTSEELFPRNYLTGVNIAQFRADGSLDFRFASERVEYYQRDAQSKHEDDYALVDAPRITFYQVNNDATATNTDANRPNLPEWYLTAEQGRAIQNFKLVELSGAVNLWQPETSDYDISIETSHLHLDTESQFAHTSEPVIMHHTNAVLRGDGLEAKLADQILTILSNGQTVYEPTP